MSLGRKVRLGVSALLLAAAAGVASAAPYRLSYGGRLTDVDGKPQAGPVRVEVHFYRAAKGGEPLGVTLPAFDKVALVDGVFALDLELSPADFATLFDGASDTWIEVTAAGKTYPRQRYAAVPYALKIPIDSDTLDFDGSGKLSVVGISQSKVSGLAATLAGKASATHTHAIADVTGLQTALDGKAALAHSHTLGGDVTGSLAATTVGKIQGSPVANTPPTSGQVLKWNGSAWAPAADLNGTGGQAEATSASNLGAGVGLFDAMVGYDLQFKSLVAGTNISLTPSATDVTIDLNQPAASGVSDGYLQATDFIAFNNKQAAITAASTLAAGTLTTAQQDGVELKPYGVAAGQTGELRFDELAGGGGNYVALKAPDSLTANVTFTLPAADGTSGQVLKTDGAAHLAWTTVAAAPVASVNGQTGTVSLTTTDVAEGTHLYYTDTRARAAVSSTTPLTYNSSTGVLGIAKADGSNGGYLSSGDWTTFNGKQDAVTTSTTLTAGQVRAGANGHVVGFKAPAALGADTVYTLPSDGTNGQFLSTNGSGTLSWTTPPGAPVTSVNGSTGAVTLTLGGLGGVPTTRTVGTAAGSGLSGGGALSSDLTLALDINGITSTTTAANGDYVPVYSTGASAVRKIARSDFLSGVAMNGSAITPTSVTTGSVTTTTLAATTLTAATVVASTSVSTPTVIASAALNVAGSMKYVDGNQAQDKILVSDASGNATWGTPKYYSQLCPAGTYMIGFDNTGTKVCSSSLTTFAKAADHGGAGHACAIMSDATVKCWGYNNQGQLGINTTTNSLIGQPVRKIDGNKLSGVTSLSLGWNDTCAVSGGQVYCWGDNSSYQGGNGVTTDNWLATPVSGITTATQVACGYYHTCALLSDGTMKCWGSNANGQIGDNTVTTRTTPVSVLSAAGGPALSGVTQITAGSQHTCALMNDATVKCWGDNTYGTLGNANNTDQHLPVAVSGLTNVSQVSAGVAYYYSSGVYWYAHTCATKTDGTAWCWGRGGYGELGNNAVANSNVPVQVLKDDAEDGTSDGPLTGVVKVTAGAMYSCAVLNDGTGRCWGINNVGQLGDGGVTQQKMAVPIKDFGGGAGTQMSQIQGIMTSAQYNNGNNDFTIVVRNDGTAAAFGANAQGQLGDNSVTNRGVPVGVVQP